MSLVMNGILAGVLTSAIVGAAPAVNVAASAVQRIDLAQALADGKLRAVNREVTKLGERNGIHLSAAPGNGIVWVEGTDFKTGTLEVDIRGKDVMQQSFVGIAFHRKADDTYEGVYLRPFNFRSKEDIRRQHAVQYISVPEFDWPRLRKEFPEEFENPVDASLEPTDWVKLRVVAEGPTVHVYVGPVTAPTLSVKKLGQLDGGTVGLWVGNGSDGDFANLVITPMK